MWNLGLVMPYPETPRVYVGTFWDKSFFFDDNRKLFEAEKNDLYNDLASLPRQVLYICSLYTFLVADTQLHIRGFVHPSVCPFVGPTAGPW